MEEPSFSPESLYEKAKAYADTTIELTKLKVLDKASATIATLVLRLVVLFFVMLFLFCANVAFSLWLGSITGQAYYGFLLVAGFYLLLALIVHFFLQAPLKKRIVDSLIAQLLN